ncbi:hypothetical protein I552_0518 [Mycobacterium xenopi 3993]|nr:hypothetical protein I552_0518 [Mycobacterium xenopi 3993]
MESGPAMKASSNPSPSARATSDKDPTEAVLAVLALVAAGAWLGYRYITNHHGILAALRTNTTLALAISTTITIAASAHLWWATHPKVASETEPDTWTLRFPSPRRPSPPPEPPSPPRSPSSTGGCTHP